MHIAGIHLLRQLTENQARVRLYGKSRGGSRARVINLGLGIRGRMWVEWARNAGAEVVGVVDVNPETLATQGERLGFGPEARFSTVAEAVACLQPDAAVLCAPNHAHPALARTCLEHGLHLLMEKPMAEDMATAVDLVTFAEKQRLQLAVAQQYRYRAPARRMREAVLRGEIGVLSGGVIQFYRWRPTRGMALPILLNQAVHHFDTLRSVLGATPVSCLAHLWNPDWNPCDGPTMVEVTFRFPNGARIHYSGSYVARGRVSPYDAYWRLEGSRGQIVYDGDHSLNLSYMEPKQDITHTLPFDEGETVIALCQDFITAVETGVAPPTSGRDNLDTLAMAFAIQRSNDLGREVSLDEVVAAVAI